MDMPQDLAEDDPTARNIEQTMISQRGNSGKRSVRPLGLVVRDSKVEMQLEKAMFRHQIRILSDLINVRKKQVYLQPTFHYKDRNSSSRLSMTSLKIEEKYRNVNNAFHAKYFNSVSQRVMSDHATKAGYGHKYFPPPACNRHFGVDGVMKSAHCDVFGPYFCSDCTRIRKRTKSAHNQKMYFPNIEVHSKALVAPEKVQQILLSQENDVVPNNPFGSSPVTDCSVFDLSTICKGPDGGGPHVFPENEIFQRVRSAKKFGLPIKSSEGIEPEVAITAPPCSRRNSFSQMSNVPEDNDMRVTVSFAV